MGGDTVSLRSGYEGGQGWGEMATEFGYHLKVELIQLIVIAEVEG